MDILQDFVLGFSWDTIIKTSLRVTMILFVALVASKIFKRFLLRFEKHLLEKSQTQGEPPTESEKRVETIIRLIRQATLIVLWLTVSLIVLKEFGVEIGPIIASAGIVGLAVGFGAQNLVRDVISGFFIILENQIRVGDVAIINGTGGLVEKINFRTTVLRDLSGVVHVFPNGTITTLSNLTNEWSGYVFDIGVAYKENTDRVIDVMKDVGKTMFEDEEQSEYMIEEPEIFGVDAFGDSAVMIKGRIKTKPIRQWQVGREYLRRIKHAFDENNIEIPFPHRSIYFGEASDAFNLKLMDQYQKLEKAKNGTNTES